MRPGRISVVAPEEFSDEVASTTPIRVPSAATSGSATRR